MAKSSPDIKPRSIIDDAFLELSRHDGNMAEHNDAGVTLEHIPFQGQFVLRALEPLSDLNEVLEDILGTALSNTPNHVSVNNQTKIFWLRERQWHIVCPADKSAALFNNIHAALKDMKSSIVDNSQGQTMLRLSGERAADILKKGCPLDIHDSVFPSGSMGLTRIVHADILLHKISGQKFDIYVRQTMGEYLARWLHDGALEYGVYIKSENRS